MKAALKKLFRAFLTKEMLAYIFFGICTTLVNIVVFQVCTALLRWNWALSNILAWILSVLFAFITNKLFVFQSKGAGLKRFLWETVTFFGARILSLGVDMAGMWLLLDLLHVNSLLSKILVNIVVIVVNYILSKFVIFRKTSS